MADGLKLSHALVAENEQDTLILRFVVHFLCASDVSLRM